MGGIIVGEVDEGKLKDIKGQERERLVLLSTTGYACESLNPPKTRTRLDTKDFRMVAQQ